MATTSTAHQARVVRQLTSLRGRIQRLLQEAEDLEQQANHAVSEAEELRLVDASIRKARQAGPLIRRMKELADQL